MIAGLPLDEGPLDDGWVTLVALVADRFDLAETYFGAAERGDPGLDRRGQGAYFIGTIAYYFAAALAVPSLGGELVPDLGSDNFALRIGGDAMDLRYRMAPASPTDRPIGAIVEAALAPLVERVRGATRLSDPAQWRLIADGIASAFLSVGEALGQREQGMQMGLAVVRDPRFRPFNGHTGYHQLNASEVYLKRGGCCRYYTCEGGAYCATCILRPPDEQLAELRARNG